MDRREFIAGAGMALAGTLSSPIHALDNEVPGSPAASISIDFGRTAGSLPISGKRQQDLIAPLWVCESSGGRT